MAQCRDRVVQSPQRLAHANETGQPVTEEQKQKRRGESSSTAVERVRAAILDGLSHGHYVPGQRLIAAELAAKLGTSQIPVREALHNLSGSGVVELIPRRGARICALSAKEFLEIWVPICRLSYSTAAERLAQSEIREAKSDEIQRLKTILVDLDVAAENRSSIGFFRAYMDLYDICAVINDNQYFGSIRTVLPVELYYRHVADILPGPLWDVYHSNVSQIVHNIIAGDHAAFIRIWDHHVELITDYVRTAFKNRE